MRKEIQQDTVRQDIQKETSLLFQKRTRNIIQDFNVYYIDKVIDLCDNRLT